MPHRLVSSLGRFFAGGALLLALGGCGSAGFQGAAGSVGTPDFEANKASTTTRTSGDTGSATGTSTGVHTNTGADEGEAATQPQQVSGAFLVCAPTNTASAAPGQATYGCDVMRGGTPADLSGAQVHWDVVHGAAGTSLGTQASIAQQAPGGQWQALVSIPMEATADAAVVASVLWPGGSAPERLVADLEAQLPTPPWTYGDSNHPLHLGDGAFDGSRCAYGLAEVPLTGAQLTVPFTVGSGGANVTVSLHGLCGVDYDQTNMLTVAAGGQPVVTVPLAAGSARASTGALHLAAGSYTVVISSGVTPQGDLDDFMIERIAISADQPITVGVPTARQPTQEAAPAQNN